MGKDLLIEVAQVDFEVAAIKAANMFFPVVKGCFFHFAQAIFRKASNIGLKPRFSDR